MGKIAIMVKLLQIISISLFITPLANLFLEVMNPTAPPILMYYFFVLMMFWPEVCAIVSKNFRRWVNDGLKDDKGKVNMKDVFSRFGTIWCIRVFIFQSITSVFFTRDIEYWQYWLPFAGGILSESPAILKLFLKTNVK